MHISVGMEERGWGIRIGLYCGRFGIGIAGNGKQVAVIAKRQQARKFSIIGKV